MGGTKWNKGGTSEGTYGPVDWDHFSVQKLPSVGSQGAENGLKMAKNVFFGHKQLWRPQMGGTKWNKGGTSKGTYGPVG